MKTFIGVVLAATLVVVALAVFSRDDGLPLDEIATAPSAALEAPVEPSPPGGREPRSAKTRGDSVDIMPVIPGEIYDPIAAGEPTPEDYRQVLPRDAILPVYNPRFVSAAESGWSDDTLVIGLELEGEAKAYPVSFLTRREMVIDWIAGSPVLVSW